MDRTASSAIDYTARSNNKCLYL
uniref:Uncharacterized protein n=1 Tax=Anguilla anguilla TaxID=7936 RepID=A0A0E9Q1A6_ANGAN